MDEPPVLVDWLPWHHTAGGNANMGMVLANGATLYIDAGKPTQTEIAQTWANLRDVAPTVYYTVPKGLEMLIEEMRRDAQLRQRFFSRLRLIFPAGAALSRPVQDAVEEMSLQEIGRKTPMTMGLGMTETAPFAISAHLPSGQAAVRNESFARSYWISRRPSQPARSPTKAQSINGRCSNAVLRRSSCCMRLAVTRV